MEVVVITLNPEKQSENQMVKVLNVLFSDIMNVEEKREQLREYGVTLDSKRTEEVDVMCNLSDLIEERGIEKGIAQGKRQMIMELIQAGVLTSQEGAKWLDKRMDEAETDN